MRTTAQPYDQNHPKGCLTICLDQILLDRLAPYLTEIDLDAKIELLILQLLKTLEPPISGELSGELSGEREEVIDGDRSVNNHREWVKQNSQDLKAHGEDIAKTGLAGAEFDRISGPFGPK